MAWPRTGDTPLCAGHQPDEPMGFSGGLEQQQIMMCLDLLSIFVSLYWLLEIKLTTYYMNQCWSSLPMHICVTRPQRVNVKCSGETSYVYQQIDFWERSNYEFKNIVQNYVHTHWITIKIAGFVI